MVQQLVWTPKQSAPKAFPERQALMPVWGGVPMPRPQWQNIWKKKLPHATDVDALAYLHIPFCANHCVFCGFYRNAWKDSQSSVYTDKIIEEMAAEAEVRTGKGKIRAVYFGGGTPTALLTEDLVRLIRACYQYLPLAEDCEFTIEGRMSHFDLEKAQACIEAGANRISIGVQTFNTAIRRRLGRKHSGDEAFEYLAKLCELDAVIVADLMFGLPNQTDEVWQNDIARATELPLSGLDTYAFNLYPMLPINRMIEKGAFPTPPGFDIQADQYAYTVETLLEKGWEQVSNSHFAYPGRGERNRYNTLIKSDISCLAFGSGAGGNFGGFSYQVQGDLESYLTTPKGEKNIAFMSGHSPNKALLSKVQHDIETGRLNPSLFDGNKAAQKLIAQWQEMQLFKEPDSDGIIRLNTSGRYWSPTLIRKLMLTLPTQEKDQTMQKLSAEQQTMLRQSLEKIPAKCWKCWLRKTNAVLKTLSAACQKRTCAKLKVAALSKFSKPSQHGMNPLPSSPTPPMPSSKSAANCLTAKSAAVSTILTIPKPTVAYTATSTMKTAPPSTFWNVRSWAKPLARSTLSTATAAPCLKFLSAATKQAS